MLIYPITDHYEPGTPSYRENAEGYFLTRKSMQRFMDHHLGGDFDRADPHVFPLHAAALEALPPALVITAGFERLREAGVDTVHLHWEGMIHGFFGQIDVIDKAGEAIGESSHWLHKVFRD